MKGINKTITLSIVLSVIILIGIGILGRLNKIGWIDLNWMPKKIYFHNIDASLFKGWSLFSNRVEKEKNINNMLLTDLPKKINNKYEYPVMFTSQGNIYTAAIISDDTVTVSNYKHVDYEIIEKIAKEMEKERKLRAGE